MLLLGKKKKNRLPKDKEKGCVGVEIWHGQKSKSNQRLESEEVKIQQFWFINICHQCLGVCPWYCLKDWSVKMSPQHSWLSLNSKNRPHRECTQAYFCYMQGQHTLKKNVSSLFFFFFISLSLSFSSGKVVPFPWLLVAIRLTKDSCKAAHTVEPVPTLSNLLIYCKWHSIIYNSLNTACKRPWESIFHGLATVCHCLRLEWMSLHLLKQKKTCRVRLSSS